MQWINRMLMRCAYVSTSPAIYCYVHVDYTDGNACVVRSLIKFNATVTSRLLAGTAVREIGWFYCFYGTILDSYREKTCSAWRWVMQFQPGPRKWQLRSTLSVKALYIYDMVWLSFQLGAYRIQNLQRAHMEALYSGTDCNFQSF
jgi:hypothetical protein